MRAQIARLILRYAGAPKVPEIISDRDRYAVALRGFPGRIPLTLGPSPVGRGMPTLNLA